MLCRRKKKKKKQAQQQQGKGEGWKRQRMGYLLCKKYKKKKWKMLHTHRRTCTLVWTIGHGFPPPLSSLALSVPAPLRCLRSVQKKADQHKTAEANAPNYIENVQQQQQQKWQQQHTHTHIKNRQNLWQQNRKKAGGKQQKNEQEKRVTKLRWRRCRCWCRRRC